MKKFNYNQLLDISCDNLEICHGESSFEILDENIQKPTKNFSPKTPKKRNSGDKFTITHNNGENVKKQNVKISYNTNVISDLNSKKKVKINLSFPFVIGDKKENISIDIDFTKDKFLEIMKELDN